MCNRAIKRQQIPQFHRAAAVRATNRIRDSMAAAVWAMTFNFVNHLTGKTRFFTLPILPDRQKERHIHKGMVIYLSYLNIVLGFL